MGACRPCCNVLVFFCAVAAGSDYFLSQPSEDPEDALQIANDIFDGRGVWQPNMSAALGDRRAQSLIVVNEQHLYDKLTAIEMVIQQQLTNATERLMNLELALMW